MPRPGNNNNGAAFKAYETQSTRIIAVSKAVLLSTVSTIRASRPDICLIPGDLTNNGELLSHTGFNQIITDSLLSADIKVYAPRVTMISTIQMHSAMMAIPQSQSRQSTKKILKSSTKI